MYAIFFHFNMLISWLCCVMGEGKILPDLEKHDNGLPLKEIKEKESRKAY